MPGKNRPSRRRNPERVARYRLWYWRFLCRQRRRRQPVVLGRREDFE